MIVSFRENVLYNQKKNKMRDNTVSRKRIVQLQHEFATMMYNFVEYTVNDTSKNQINIVSKKRIESECQIISFRENVLCSQITSRFRKAKIRSKKNE